jgi:hypothetical protein
MASSVIAAPVQKQQYGFFRTILNLFRGDRIWTAEQLVMLNPGVKRVSLSAGGRELEILKAASETLQRDKPVVYLNNHGRTPAEQCRNIESIVCFMGSLGYSVTHVRSGQRITRENLHIVRNGQVYCE